MRNIEIFNKIPDTMSSRHEISDGGCGGGGCSSDHSRSDGCGCSGSCECIKRRGGIDLNGL